MSPAHPASSVTKDTITVLVADDHELFLEALAALVSTIPSCRVVGIAHDGREAANQTKKLRPQVVLMGRAHARAVRR